MGTNEESKETFLTRIKNKWYDSRPATIAEFKKDEKLMVLNETALYRQPSSVLPAAGKGLFARAAIPKGRLITWYSGARVAELTMITRLSQQDAELKAYRMGIGLNAVPCMLGNYTWPAGSALPVRVNYDDLERVFANDGAAQFMNGERTVASPLVNVGMLTVYSALRNFTVPEYNPNRTPAESLAEYKGRIATIIPSLSDEKGRKFPDEALLVAVALVDIPAETELITAYGATYFDNAKGGRNLPVVFRRR